MKCFLVVFLLVPAAIASNIGNATSPVTKVVNLLSDLKSKIAADGKTEEQMYNKYACWCEKTSKRKASDITTAEQDLRSLGQQILSLKGSVATLTAEIQELDDKIEENEAQQEEATSVREKRNKKFMASTAETKQALAALESAIKVLVEGTGTKLLQTNADLAARVARTVQSVLDTLPSDADIKKDDVAFLSEFVSSGAGEAYAPQSATIQGMLTDMYSTFATDLEEATATEAKQNRNFEKLIATLQKEAIELKTVKSRKEIEKSEKESTLADTTATFDETTEQMKADIEFFDKTKAACKDKHSEYSLRVELREQELLGVDKAIAILNTDDARDLFASAIKPGVEAAASFLQLDDAEAFTLKAYDMLKTQARKSKSLRLAALAVRLRMTKVGHFDAVIKAIDEMIQVLAEEGEADLAKKTQCEDEYQKVALNVQDSEWKIENNEAQIDKLEKIIKLRETEKQETIDQMDETKDYMKKITDERKEEHQDFLNAVKEDEAAIKLLQLAKAALSAYYKKNKIPLGPIQGSVKMLQQTPTFEVSEDQAPDATFSHKGSHKLQSKGIISLMDYIIEDLQDEVSNARKDEEKSQADYEDEMITAKNLFVALESKKSSLEEIISKRGEDKAEENEVMKNNIKELDDENKYKAAIKPDCDWIMKAFDQRATARAAENEGLVSAKEFLAGKQALLQIVTHDAGKTALHDDDDKLGHIRFLGVRQW